MQPPKQRPSAPLVSLLVHSPVVTIWVTWFTNKWYITKFRLQESSQFLCELNYKNRKVCNHRESRESSWFEVLVALLPSAQEEHGKQAREYELPFPFPFPLPPRMWARSPSSLTLPHTSVLLQSDPGWACHQFWTITNSASWNGHNEAPAELNRIILASQMKLVCVDQNAVVKTVSFNTYNLASCNKIHHFYSNLRESCWSRSNHSCELGTARIKNDSADIHTRFWEVLKKNRGFQCHFHNAWTFLKATIM